MYADISVSKFEQVSNVHGVVLKKLKSIDNRKVNEIESTNDWQLELLMIADYSVYESFLALYNNDHYSTRCAIEHYLTALFNQVSRYSFSNSVRLDQS